MYRRCCCRWLAGLGCAVINADSNRRGRRPVLYSASVHDACSQGGPARWGSAPGRGCLVLCLFGRPGSGCRVLAVGSGSVALVIAVVDVDVSRAVCRSQTSAVPC